MGASDISKKKENRKANVILNKDCIEGMRKLPDKSIDLIVTDPPYNIGKAKWDKIKNYIEWCGLWIAQCERVLKDTGSFYFFHNDMEQMAEIQHWIKKNTNFVFNSFIVWDKCNFRALSWKNPSEKSKLRCWFNTCEYCIAYTFQKGSGLNNVMYDMNNFSRLRNYFEELQGYIKLNKKQLIEAVGQGADHCFRWGSSQWNMPMEETYNKLIDVYRIDKFKGFREYGDLLNEFKRMLMEYEALRFTHNVDENHNNVWRQPTQNNGSLHPTQKPTNLISRIIKCSSNEGDIVCDPFMGSGTTAVACIQTGRRYIGYELDKGYYDVASRRIDEEMRQIRLDI